jgi:hypothetical protein
MADRAWLALLADTLPIDRLAGMRLIVTRPRSCAGIVTPSASAGRAGRGAAVRADRPHLDN